MLSFCFSCLPSGTFIVLESSVLGTCWNPAVLSKVNVVTWELSLWSVSGSGDILHALKDNKLLLSVW